MEGDITPTWFHHTATLRSRSRQSRPLLNPVILIILTITVTLIVVYLIFPSFISLTSNITIKPVSIKKGWDSLNILLILFAVLCGIFAKPNVDDVSPTLTESQSLDSDRWYECYERKPEKEVNQLRRNSSSYPDLRQASEWDNGYNQFKFFDDIQLTTMQYNRHRVSEVEEKDSSDIKVVPVDSFQVVQPSPPRQEATEPRLVQSLPKYRRKDRDIELEKSQAQHAMLSAAQVERKRKRRQRIRSTSKEQEKAPVLPRLFPPPTLPPPPPPPPPPPSFYNIFRKRNKNKKVHSISGQPPPPPPPPPLPMSHLFNNMFKTGSRSKRLENKNPVIVPPPPPPPPPRSIFNNMFKTGSKNKKFQNRYSSIAPPPPPPPPPPPRSIFNNMFKPGSKSKRYQTQHHSSTPPLPSMSSVFNDLFNIDPKTESNRYEYKVVAPSPPPTPPRRSTVSYGRPPLPTKSRNLNDKDENPLTGAESPMISIPHPPPLPPFKMSRSGFVAKGDFVRIKSTHSSRCSSPDLEDVDLSSFKMNYGDGSASSDLSSSKIDGEDALGRSITCPSPDVNSKADSFIARLKGEWKLEKMNSIKKKQLSPRNALSHKSY